MNIFIYTNCQGVDGIKNILLSINNQFKINCFLVHSGMQAKLTPNKELLKDADIFIYQPIHERHGEYSTNHIINNILKKDCKTISFPYIYNSAFFSTYLPMINYTVDENGNRLKPEDNIELFKEKSFLHGFGHVCELIEDGKNLEEIIKIYRSGEMNFNFDKRWEICISKLREREKNCDIHVADFLELNKNKHMLFLQHNHPTTCVYLHLVEQIFEIINFNFDFSSVIQTYWDVSDMLKRTTNVEIDSLIQYYNTHKKWIQAVDSYSKKQWNENVLKNYVEDEKYTENEIIDFYLSYYDILKHK